MLVDGRILTVGRTIAFDYTRRTASSGLAGWTSRIGKIEKIDPSTGTVTIRETGPNGNQYRAFKAVAMTNVMVD